MTSIDKAKGLMVGLHLGDSMGAFAEFSKWSRAGIPVPLAEIPSDHLVKPGWARRYGHPEGMPTDDTRCARALAESLVREAEGIREGRLPADASWQDRYVRQFITVIPDGCYGRQMRAAKAALRAGTPVPDNGNESNGSMMAVAPIALLDRPLDLRQKMAREYASLTHPSEVIASVNEDYIALLDAALRDDVAGIQRVDLPAEPHGPSKGWCRLMLAVSTNALVDVIDGVSPLDTLRTVISLGGDTDTSAAISGALIGALVGLSGLPGHLVDSLHWGQDMADLGVSLAGI